MRGSVLLGVLVLPMLTAASFEPEPRGAGPVQVDWPLLVDENGDTMTGDLALMAELSCTDCVDSDDVQEDAVGYLHLQQDSVRVDILSDSSVETGEITDGQVMTQDLADGAVTRAKLAPGIAPTITLVGGRNPGQTAFNVQWSHPYETVPVLAPVEDATHDLVIRSPGFLRDLSLGVKEHNMGAGERMDFVVMKNGAETALKVSVLNSTAKGTFFVDTDLVPVARGDRIALKADVEGTVNARAVGFAWTFEYEAQ